MSSPFPISVHTAIANHAHEYPDIEVCGIVLANDEVVRSTNIANDPSNHFILDDRTTELLYRTEVKAVYHSHCLEQQPRLMEFSGLDDVGRWVSGDVALSQRSGLPYLMYHTLERSWDYYDPQGLHPYPLQQSCFDAMAIEFYLGWRWSWGRSDCYSLMRSYYRGKLGIELPLIERSPDPRECQQVGWDRFRQGLVENGFVRLDVRSRLQNNDVILMKAEGQVNWHHVGMVCDAVKSYVVHAPPAPRLSARIVYGGEWFELTEGVYRHSSLGLE